MNSWENKKQYHLGKNSETRSKNKQYFFLKRFKNQTLFMVVSVFVVFAIMLGTTYAVFSSVKTSQDFNGLDVGDLHINYSDDSGSVSLANSYPMSDADGNNSTPYTFSIQNTGSLATTYSIKLLDDVALIDGEEKTDEEMVNKLLSKSDLKVSVNGGTPTLLENLSVSNYEIANGSLQPGETKKFSVRLWIKSDASNNIFIKNSDGSLTGKYYFGKISVAGENTRTYETDGALIWLDAMNNGDEGHDSTVQNWYDLSGNDNDYAMSNFTNYAWNDNSLELTNVSSIGVSYDVSSLTSYTISTAFTVKDIADGAIFPLIDVSNINIYLEGTNLKVGNSDDIYQIQKNTLYDVVLVKKQKTIKDLSNQSTLVTVCELYINGQLYKDVTDISKETITASAASIDLYNYIVYNKALSLNKINRNYSLTRSRYGA